MQMELDDTDRIIHIKIQPGTDDYNMVKHAHQFLNHLTMSKVARLLIRTGYLGFLRSIKRQSEGVAK